MSPPRRERSIADVLESEHRLAQQVQRVRELHYAYDAMDRRRRCGCCGHPWPCLTATAVGGDDE